MLSDNLKKLNPQIKASREIKSKKKRKISISFQYLTANPKFNFHFFKKELRAKSQTFEQLVEFLKGLTAKTILDISNHRKEQIYGFELLEFEQIKFSPDNYELGQDAKIHDFRFGDGKKYRLLGFFEHNQTVLNIIGFNFKYSAYNHG